MDNHLPDGLYPVLVSKREDEDSSRQGGDGGGGGTRGRGKEEPVPFLQLAVIKEVNQATNTAHFDYVAFRWGRVGWDGLYVSGDRTVPVNLTSFVGIHLRVLLEEHALHREQSPSPPKFM